MLYTACLFFLATGFAHAALVTVEDSYGIPASRTLSVEASGVLDNDTLDGKNAGQSGVTATLLTGVSKGTLACPGVGPGLCADGSFEYTPGTGFDGFDSFQYQAVSVSTSETSPPTTVTLSACSGGPTVYTCWHEAPYLAKLTELSYNAFQEGFEGTAWDVARSPTTAPSIVSNGVTWTTNHPATNEITTGNGPARTGAWGVYDPNHGVATGTVAECDIDNPPVHCLPYDGFSGSMPGPDVLYGVGGYITGFTGANVDIILDGTSHNVGKVTGPGHHFMGVIDTAGFNAFEFREVDGKVGQFLYIFGDDFTIATSATPPGSVQFDSASYTVAEDGVTATITVTRTGGSFGAASVYYATSDGTATLADGDYTATSGTINFADGDDVAKTFSVTVANNAGSYEGDEIVNLALSNATGATLGTPSSTVLTITENDPVPLEGSVQFGTPTYTEAEDGVTATINVTRTGASGDFGATSADYTTTDGSANAGGDYIAANGTVNFAAGDAVTKSFSITIINSPGTYEGDETVNLNLSNPTGGASLGTPSSSILTIIENDPVPVDVTLPVITLLGSNPVNIEVGNTYTDAGATAADNIDGDISANIIPTSTVDTITVGSYTVTYNVSDAAGNLAAAVVRTVNVTAVANHAPAADAGLDQTVPVSDTVTLDGSGSTDIDGDTLSFSWSLTSPAGSAATLSDPSAVTPTFYVDLPGSYTAELIVNDGIVDSAADSMIISTTNSAPVANAGQDQTVLVGNTVTLDGSGSTDVDGDALIFSWSLTTPVGSAATLSNPSAVTPTLVIDLQGTYVAQLIVNDGAVDSAADTVSISTSNSAPVADAGADQAAHVGDTVTLDGSASSDFDGDALTFSWSLTTPAGSSASLSNPTTINPAFVVDLPGIYVAQLIVRDGSVNSVADTASISTTNSAPVADAGTDLAVLVNEIVMLDGSGSSDADGDVLIFNWALTTVPAGSVAVLSDTTVVNPSFDVDLPGTYVVQLIVNDGSVDSTADTVSIIINSGLPGNLQFSNTLYKVNENVGTAIITVTRVGGSAGTVSVDYATSDDTAIAGSDYTKVNSTLSFADGVTSQSFKITILQDTKPENNESLTINLSNPGGGAGLGLPAAATVVIADDDTQTDSTATGGSSGGSIGLITLMLLLSLYLRSFRTKDFYQ